MFSLLKNRTPVWNTTGVCFMSYARSHDAVVQLKNKIKVINIDLNEAVKQQNKITKSMEQNKARLSTSTLSEAQKSKINDTLTTEAKAFDKVSRRVGILASTLEKNDVLLKMKMDALAVKKEYAAIKAEAEKVLAKQKNEELKSKEKARVEKEKAKLLALRLKEKVKEQAKAEKQKAQVKVDKEKEKLSKFTNVRRQLYLKGIRVPPTPYAIFVSDNVKNKKMTFSQAAQEWRSMSEEQKAQYSAKYKELRAIYESAKAEIPKRSPSTYARFYKAQWELLPEKLPVVDFAKKMGALWKTMSEEQKAEYKA